MSVYTDAYVRDILGSVLGVSYNVCHSFTHCADYFPFGDRAGDISLVTQPLFDSASITIPIPVVYDGRDNHFIRVRTVYKYLDFLGQFQ